MAQLPLELIVEILLRLPVKSLLRFRCVSKSISAVIDSLDFINSHLCKSSENFNFHNVLLWNPSQNTIHFSDVYPDLDLEEEILRPEKPSLRKELYGYCNGLLLLSSSSFCVTMSKLALWNPSTHKYRDLPVCPFQVSDDVQLYGTIGSGLSYDDSTDDYKVCFILLVKTFEKFECQFWIYGLNSNNWRRVQNFPSYDFTHILGYPRMGYFSIDGTLHWLCAVDRFKSDIVAFDVRKETFSIVPQPVTSMEEVSRRLHVLEGCLCISYFFSSPPSQAHLYMRKKDGNDQFSWTQLYSVKEPLSFDISVFQYLNVFGYSKKGDKILLEIERGHNYIVWFDLKEKSFTKVERDMDPNPIAPILCLDSLVSVGGGA